MILFRGLLFGRILILGGLGVGFFSSGLGVFSFLLG